MVPALMSTPDVERLAARAQCGERAAFAALVERFQGPLLHFLSLRTASRDDAEELVQETFLRAWRYLDRYDPRRPFATWLYTLGRRLSISEQRRRRLRTAEPEALDAALDDTAAGGPPNVLEDREQRENLWRLARRVLKPEAHSALWLRYGEELDTHKIARILDKREPTVRVILFRARARLARSLGEPASASTVGPVAAGGPGGPGGPRGPLGPGDPEPREPRDVPEGRAGKVPPTGASRPAPISCYPPVGPPDVSLEPGPSHG